MSISRLDCWGRQDGGGRIGRVHAHGIYPGRRRRGSHCFERRARHGGDTCRPAAFARFYRNLLTTPELFQSSDPMLLATRKPALESSKPKSSSSLAQILTGGGGGGTAKKCRRPARSTLLFSVVEHETNRRNKSSSRQAAGAGTLQHLAALESQVA